MAVREFSRAAGREPANGMGAVWARLKRGEHVVMSDESLDRLAARFCDDESDDADLFFSDLASIPNPSRCGVHDKYICWLASLEGGAA